MASYELLERPEDYLVMYAQAVGDVARIAPIERIGTFGTLREALDAVDRHHATR